MSQMTLGKVISQIHHMLCELTKLLHQSGYNSRYLTFVKAQ